MPVSIPGKQKVSPSSSLPAAPAGAAVRPDDRSWNAAVQHLRAKYGKKITQQWLNTYFPPSP